jgi:hypothetical protein
MAHTKKATIEDSAPIDISLDSVVLKEDDTALTDDGAQTEAFPDPQISEADELANALAVEDAAFLAALKKLDDQENELKTNIDLLDAAEWEKFDAKEELLVALAGQEKQFRVERFKEKLADKHASKFSSITEKRLRLIDNAEAFKAEQKRKSDEKIENEKRKLAAKIAKKAERAEKTAENKKLRESSQSEIKKQKESENQERKNRLDERKAELEKFPGRRRKATDFVYIGEGFSTPQKFSVRGKVYQFLKDNYTVGSTINVESFGEQVKGMLFGANVRSFLGKLEEFGQIDFVTPVDVPVEAESDKVALHDDFADEDEDEGDDDFADESENQD